MTITEPMTLVTDYLLAAVSAWLAWRLRGRQPRARHWWSIAFGSLALGALLGGTWHGLVQDALLWKATLLSVGVASFAMVAGSAFATLSGRARDALLWVAGAKLVFYWWWMLGHDQFIYVVLDTGIAFAAVAAMHLWRWNAWILAGVVVSVGAAFVQASGFALHEHFNHNDLFHVLQTFGVVCFARAAERFDDR